MDLVVDHSVQVDVSRSHNAVQANMELEFERNRERFGFLKWGSNAFQNMLVVPPGSGIVHQVHTFPFMHNFLILSDLMFCFLLHGFGSIFSCLRARKMCLLHISHDWANNVFY